MLSYIYLLQQRDVEVAAASVCKMCETGIPLLRQSYKQEVGVQLYQDVKKEESHGPT